MKENYMIKIFMEIISVLVWEPDWRSSLLFLLCFSCIAAKGTVVVRGNLVKRSKCLYFCIGEGREHGVIMAYNDITKGVLLRDSKDYIPHTYEI